MKYAVFFLITLCIAVSGGAQPLHVYQLKTDAALTDPDNQFSGLYILGKTLFLMSESRAQEHAEGKLYAVDLSSFGSKPDTAQTIHGSKIPLIGLEVLAAKISGYEGLEAFVIKEDSIVYFSVETHTEEDNCYLIKGQLTSAAVAMDTAFLLPLHKPTTPGGKHIYNAGFEAMGIAGNDLYAFYEYNGFPNGNSAYCINISHPGKAAAKLSIVPLLASLPFRITDLTAIAPGSFTGINYFYPGGSDNVYRPLSGDSTNNRLVKRDGEYTSYCRLITISTRGKGISWKPLGSLPPQYFGYNFEGIAAWKEGYFIINDKYTPSKPYHTELLFVF